jgi:hypothetical protein
MAAQFTSTMGQLLCAFFMNPAGDQFFSVPLSPVIKTRASVGATFSSVLYFLNSR